MNFEEQRKAIVINKKISSILLVSLLVVRLLDQELFGGAKPDWAIDWYHGVAYILTLAIIWLNRHRLEELNIDWPFMVIIMTGGALTTIQLSSVSKLLGTLVGITTGFIIVAYKYRMFVFKKPTPYPKITGLLIFLSIFLAIAPILLFPSPIKNPPNLSMLINTFIGGLIFNLGLNVFEEVVFRGALWAHLRDLGLNERVVFVTQTVLFWVAHHRYLFNNQLYAFWVGVLGISVLLGLLVWYTKSLTPSVIVHFLYNFIHELFLKIY
jgi:membrane protease YdiL (CAAX protease family)